MLHFPLSTSALLFKRDMSGGLTTWAVTSACWICIYQEAGIERVRSQTQAFQCGMRAFLVLQQTSVSCLFFEPLHYLLFCEILLLIILFHLRLSLCVGTCYCFCCSVALFSAWLCLDLAACVLECESLGLSQVLFVFMRLFYLYFFLVSSIAPYM